jgi:hypothetical protein
MNHQLIQSAAPTFTTSSDIGSEPSDGSPLGLRMVWYGMVLTEYHTIPYHTIP